MHTPAPDCINVLHVNAMDLFMRIALKIDILKKIHHIDNI